MGVAERRSVLQPLLLSKIIEFDLSRILSRLRSKHMPAGRSSGRPAILYLLYDTVHKADITPKMRRGLLYSRLQTQTKTLKDIFDRFELKEAEEAKGSAGQDMIADILWMVTSFNKEFDLARFLGRCKGLDPSIAHGLPRSCAKVARYYTLSDSLISAARDGKYTIFKAIRVTTVDARGFLTTAVTTQHCSFDQVLSRYALRNSNAAAVNRARRMSSTILDQDAYLKVHAEVQLLYFYEIQQVPTVPRILSASKSACYLCHLFISSHGKFRVPRTHGRLYDRWTLPDIPQGVNHAVFLEAAHRLNLALESRIRQALRTPYRSINFPAESVVALNSAWTPDPTITNSSASTVRGSGASTIRQVSLKPLEVQSHSPRSTSAAENLLPLEHVSDRETGAVMTDELLQSNEIQPVIASRNHTSRSSEVPSIMSADITWQCFRLSSILSNLWFRHEGLDLFLEWPDFGHSTRTERWMAFKYIDRFETTAMSETGNSFDLARLSLDTVESSQETIESNGSLTLVWSDTSLVVRFGHGTPPEDLDNEDQIPAR